jgi:hypothetical protein
MFRSALSLTTALIVISSIAVLPAAAQGPTDKPAPGAKPGACGDLFPPTSGFTSRAARSARRTHVLRGTASDRGCGLDRVAISVARRVGRRCQNLSGASRLGRKTSCSKLSWLAVKGTTRWSFRLPKRLRHGTYIVRTQAFDFGGNAQRPRAKRLVIR